MSFAHRLRDFLQAPAPGFICCGCGRRTDKRYLASLQHHANPPASGASLAALAAFEPEAVAELVACLREADGALLCSAPGAPGDASEGFLLFPSLDISEAAVAEWLNVWFEDDQEAAEELLRARPVAVAEVLRSGNLIALDTAGPTAGRLRDLNHDPGMDADDPRLPKTYREMVESFMTDPARFLYWQGCITRYSDGVTKEQWIPLRYVTDVSAIDAAAVAEEPLPEWMWV